MADGSQTIEIDAALADALRAEATAAGVSFEDYVTELLMSRLPLGPDDDFDPDPAIDLHIAEEALRTGAYVTLDEFRERMKTFGKPRRKAP